MIEIIDAVLPLPLQRNERHWTIRDLSERWNLSRDVLYEWFRDAPGVLVIMRPERTHHQNRKRKYTTFRVRESVALRVYHEHQTK